MNLNDPELTEYQRDFFRLNVKPRSGATKTSIGYLLGVLTFIVWLLALSSGVMMPASINNLGHFGMWLYTAFTCLVTFVMMIIALFYQSDAFKKSCSVPEKKTALTKTLLNGYCQPSVWRQLHTVTDVIIIFGVVMNGFAFISVVLTICFIVFLIAMLVIKAAAISLLKEMKPTDAI